ncbi:MAG: hypothetical protein V5783_01435 [Pontiella sp.]
MKTRKPASHAKSSAALVSLGIHAILILVAVSFVAVKVIHKEEQKFEAKPVNRPKMQLKKLQVPVNIKKKQAQKPKLRKRIVVQPKINQKVPDIKMPEITGIKGGLGNLAGIGLGNSVGIGFSMPEIDIFGIKGKGEKIFLILDTSNSMLIDEMGGIPAYTIIKEELTRIVESLPSTALINVAVFRGNAVQTVFPKMAPANTANTQKVKAWLEPLNSSSNAAKSGNYGIRTLGKGGTTMREDLRIGSFSKPAKKGGRIYGGKSNGSGWYSAVMLAHKQQADMIFLLTNTWGYQRVAINTSTSAEEWKSTSPGKKWAANLEKAKKLFKEENKERKAKGQPPKVLSGGSGPLIREYFPSSPRPPRPQYYNFQPKEFAEAFKLTREKYQGTKAPTSSGLGRRKSNKKDFTFNVVQFVKKDGEAGTSAVHYKKLTGLCRGEYQTVAGLEEIKSYASSD